MAKKKIQFIKNQALDFSNNLEYACDEIKCGDMTFTMKSFKLQHGHNDSLPYYAILYCNKKPICECVNDGWGGTTSITPLDKSFDIVKNDLDGYSWAVGKYTIKLTLDFIADILAESKAIKKSR